MLRFELKIQTNKVWIYFEQFPSYFTKSSSIFQVKSIFFFSKTINNEIALLGGMFQVAICDYNLDISKAFWKLIY